VALRIAVDTNRYVDFCKDDPTALATLEMADQVVVPFVVMAELRAGFAVGTLGKSNERILQRFLRRPGVSVLYAGDATVRAYASLYRQLRQQGTPIPVNDMWIGALVVEHGLALCSRDAHFRHLPQIEIV
jgi:tRNA(fMet)-specific endonuclease VapC